MIHLKKASRENPDRLDHPAIDLLNGLPTDGWNEDQQGSLLAYDRELIIENNEDDYT